jgi:xanthine dehydrogenase molybdopterin-binding subunit B
MIVEELTKIPGIFLGGMGRLTGENLQWNSLGLLILVKLLPKM